MKTKFLLLFVFASLFMGGCAAHGKFRAAGAVSAKPYVIVYGKESCPACKDFKRGLDRERVDYTFKDINDPRVQGELYPRMERAGMNADYFPLPVVDVNGELAAFPSLDDTMERYRRAPGPS